jgi:hypothetical protein
MQRVLQLLHESTGNDYSTYYADVRTELHKLFAKYERKFGAVRSQRVTHPANHTGKKKTRLGENIWRIRCCWSYPCHWQLFFSLYCF